MITVKAYAKINLRLNVLGKRTDGYHEVENLMQAIELCDDVSVECKEEGEGLVIDLKPGRDDLPSDAGNLAYRAAVLMHETFHPGKAEVISIRVVKRIPVAAGLAGGSADAAAVINALAELWNVENDDRIHSLAAGLGADIPFCVASQRGCFAAVATGTGTELAPVSAKAYKVVLTTPAVPVPTKAVFAELRPDDYRTPFTGFGNHLQAPALRLFPEIREVIEAHEKLPGRLLTQLSGSGPSVFSLYEKDAQIPDISQLSSHYFTVLTETKV